MTPTERMAKAIVDHENETMRELSIRYFRSGMFQTYQDAEDQTIMLYGKAAAQRIQTKLRLMGARDLIVTCP